MIFKNKISSLALVLVLFCFVGANVSSQQPTVDAQTRNGLKLIMTHLLQTIYVSPEIGAQLSKQLTAKFEAGAYDKLETPAQVAEALSRDLRELSKDKHLLVRYDPAASVGDKILTVPEWETRRASMFRMDAPAPRPGSPQPGGAQPRMTNQLRQDNYHFRESKILSGNVGYLDLGGFAPGPAAREAAAKSMAALAGSEALIIDLRRCPGGTSEMVNFLASYFFDKEPRVLMNRYIRPTGETIQSKTVADIPGKRLLDTDLYLLVSANTASACESFPYTLQQFGRAKVVGERTAGAGYNNIIIPLGKGYLFSVSFGRPSHPRSGKGWEGEGVQPDIAVSADKALETAQRETLQTLISKATDENRKKELNLALQNIAAGRDTTSTSDATSSRSQIRTGNGSDRVDARQLLSDKPSRAIDDDDLAKRLGAYLEQAGASDAFSGVVLIAKNGQPIFKQAYGMADKSNNTPNTTDMKFDLGSMNKMFTAVAIAQLAERGKLSFTDTIGKLLPDYPNKAIAEKVTVHQLLTHTSGMGSYFNEKFMANLNNMKTVGDYLTLFANDPLAFEPGTKWQYSNSGFVVLGLIIEKLSGESYYGYVREHIFKPAGMTNTDSYERDKDTPNLAIGYTRMGVNGRPDPSAARRANTSMRPFKGSPAGGGYSTVDDMLKFSLALRDHKLLNAKYTEILTTGKVETGAPGRKYAYGFGEEVSDGRRLIGHNGGGPGIGANFDIFPELGYTAVILGNYDSPAMMPVMRKIRELLLPAAAPNIQQSAKP